MRAAVALSLLSLLATPAAADVIANGSFASNFTDWGTPGAPAVVYSIVSSTRDATNAARVTSRTQFDQAPRQNILALLQPLGSGITFTTRFWISLSAPASVRCYAADYVVSRTRRRAAPSPSLPVALRAVPPASPLRSLLVMPTTGSPVATAVVSARSTSRL